MKFEEDTNGLLSSPNKISPLLIKSLPVPPLSIWIILEILDELIFDMKLPSP